MASETIRDRGVRFTDGFFAGFVAGLAAAAVNTLAIWLAGVTGLAAGIGAAAATFSLEEILSRLAFGALWGMVFAPLAFISKIERLVAYGVVFSAAPTVVQWFVVFPLKGSGVFGLDLGVPTTLMVIAYNALYGLVLGFLFRFIFGATREVTDSER